MACVNQVSERLTALEKKQDAAAAAAQKPQQQQSRVADLLARFQQQQQPAHHFSCPNLLSQVLTQQQPVCVGARHPGYWT